MLKNNVRIKAIPFLMIAALSFFGCERIGRDSPVGFENQSLEHAPVFSAINQNAVLSLQPSSVPGINLPEGFDAQIFITRLNLPESIVLESTGNLLVGSDSYCASILRLSTAGAIIARSEGIFDPDGVAFDNLGRVFVAGLGDISIVNSLNGGTDVIFATGFTNLNDIAIDSHNRIVVAENNGQIYEVTATGRIVEPPLATLPGYAIFVIFDKDNRLFAGGQGSLVRIDGGIIPVTTVPINDPVRMIPGPAGVFGNEHFVTEMQSGRILKIDEATGMVTTFATGFNRPMGMALKGPDTLFVAEAGLGRIIKIYRTFTEVTIDLKPGSDPNSINCKNQNGVISVAILTTDVFNVMTADPLTVRFGRTGTEAVETHGKGHIEDVDSDGDLDMVLHFRFGDTGIKCGDTEAILTGKTYDGKPIQGADAIRTVRK